MKVTVSSYGRIVIPRNLREKYGIIQGTKFEISYDDGVIRLKPRLKLSSICGTWALDRDQVEKSIMEGRRDSVENNIGSKG